MTVPRCLLTLLTALAPLLLFGPPALADDCDPWDIAVATNPVPPQSARTLHRAEDIAASLPASADTVVIGDSIAEQWSQHPSFAATFGNSAVNLGLGYDQTQNLLWRLGDQRLAVLSPRQVVLAVGTNNLSGGQAGCAAADGVVAVIERLRQLWPEARLTYIPVLPRGPDFGYREADRELVNEVAGKVAGVTIVEVNEDELTCGLRGIQLAPPDAACPLPQYSACDRYQKDNIHLAAPGYDVLATSVLQALSAG